MTLTDAQQAAIAHIDNLSKGDPIDQTLRVTLHFHPDRIHEKIHILDAMVQSGVYRSQFETGTSNGGLSAHPGGDRWRWESRLFGTAYDNAPPRERPKYGSLNYKRSPYGGSPRFGSAHIRLTKEALLRSTFCYPDSTYEPEAFGTAQHMALVQLATADNQDLLDDYVEAHVHGDLHIATDVEALVLDPSYRGTDVEQIANKLGCPIEWHNGFELSIAEMEKYAEYRGPQYIDLARNIAQNGILTPHAIGLAALTDKYDLQDLKKVWHYVARFGQKASPIA